jgi:hypothetical protein
VRVADHLTSLYAHLLENRFIDSIVGFDTNILGIFSRDALKKIRDQDLLWEKMVPTPIAIAIKHRGLFGHVNPAATGIGVSSDHPVTAVGMYAPDR